MELQTQTLVSFSVERAEGRKYSFIMPTNSPAGEVYDVLYECLNKVIQLSQENVKAMERKEEK
jgi:hypothetical protein